jgi:hypothetical protein
MELALEVKSAGWVDAHAHSLLWLRARRASNRRPSGRYKRSGWVKNPLAMIFNLAEAAKKAGVVSMAITVAESHVV